MKLVDLSAKIPSIKVGKCYKLDKREKDDYSELVVYVEKGPRNSGPSEQYRVSTGPNNYDVDWISSSRFINSKEVTEPAGIRYSK
jgi:hypothetical protein